MLRRFFSLVCQSYYVLGNHNFHLIALHSFLHPPASVKGQQLPNACDFHVHLKICREYECILSGATWLIVAVVRGDWSTSGAVIALALCSCFILKRIVFREILALNIFGLMIFGRSERHFAVVFQ